MKDGEVGWRSIMTAFGLVASRARMRVTLLRAMRFLTFPGGQLVGPILVLVEKHLPLFSRTTSTPLTVLILRRPLLRISLLLPLPFPALVVTFLFLPWMFCASPSPIGTPWGKEVDR